jgi:hypothetical protein
MFMNADLGGGGFGDSPPTDWGKSQKLWSGWLDLAQNLN